MPRSTAILACLLMLICEPGQAQQSIYRSGSFPLASCKSWNATIAELKGQDSSQALMRGSVTDEDLREYCERDPGGLTTTYGGKLTVEGCVAQLTQEVRGSTPSQAVVIATADCRKKRIRSHKEIEYEATEIKSLTPNEVGIVWRHVRTGQMLDGSCASGAPPLTEQFKLLCPSLVSHSARGNDPKPGRGPAASAAALMGAWGGRAAYAGDDNPKAAAEACASFKKNPNAAMGDIIVFTATEFRSYGGYMDYVDKLISASEIGPSRWKLSRRHYHDGEGGGRAGNRTVIEEFEVKGDLLIVRSGKRISRYNRCPS